VDWKAVSFGKGCLPPNKNSDPLSLHPHTRECFMAAGHALLHAHLVEKTRIRLRQGREKALGQGLGVRPPTD
jgi:hypothetical protein